MSHALNTTVSASIWNALTERAQTSGQSVSHIVQAALSEALDVEHHSLFQVSTSGAIVQGLYQGCVCVADLRRHGNLGLGTFEDLDGEMILIDGHCFQARADGTVHEAADSALTPFACVVNFAPDTTSAITNVESLASFTNAVDAVRTSANGIVAIRAHGIFNSMQVRAACKAHSGQDLVSATADQSEFTGANMTGTVVGFWSPEYTKAVAISGYHLHFISDDRSFGGHVLDLNAPSLTVEINEVNDVHLAIPETTEFLRADFTHDVTDALNIAEGQRRHPEVQERM